MQQVFTLLQYLSCLVINYGSLEIVNCISMMRLGLTKYKVIPPSKHCQHIVEYDSSASTVMCSCKKFEFVGILCAHALKLLSLQNFKRVLDQYIFKMWKNDAKDGFAINTCMCVGLHDQNAC